MADYHLTTTGAGTKSGTSWANAFDLSAFDTWYENSANAGDTCYVYSGTYTLSDNISSNRSGSTSNFLKIVGVSDTAYTPAEGTDRPLFDCGTHYFGNYGGGYTVYENLRAHTSNVQGFRNGTSTQPAKGGFRNCYVKQESGMSTYPCYQLGSEGWAYDCEAEGGGDSVGFAATNHRCQLVGCYAHDLDYAFYASSVYGLQVAFCVGESCTYGCYFVSADGGLVFNNTLDGNTTGIYLSYGGVLLLNNIVSNNTTGISVSSDKAWCDWNHYYNNGTDISGGSKGPNASSGDPLFVDRTNGDFSLQSGSPCREAGFSMRLAAG